MWRVSVESVISMREGDTVVDIYKLIKTLTFSVYNNVSFFFSVCLLIIMYSFRSNKKVVSKIIKQIIHSLSFMRSHIFLVDYFSSTFFYITSALERLLIWEGNYLLYKHKPSQIN